MYRETSSGGINYVHLGDRLVAKEGTGVVSSGDSIMNYKPFGDSIEEPKDDVGYTGHKFDTDLGLSYMQARYYDPVIGRFYSNDPIGSVEHLNTENGIHGFNRYAYANNNPYAYTDPTGESTTTVGGGIGCAVSGPACPVGAVVGGVIGTVIGVVGVLAYNEMSDDSPADPEAESGNDPDPADKSGELSRSGRALQKHGGRKGSAFPPATGKTADKNKQGQDILEGIVNDPEASASEGNRFGGTDVTASDGKGARFDKDGKFRGFLEPKRENKE